MKMDMMNSLSAVLAAVINDTVTTFGDPQLVSKLCDHMENVTHHRGIFFRQCICRGNMVFRYNQNMYRCRRTNIMEGVYLLILIHFIRGNFPLYDFAKKTIHSGFSLRLFQLTLHRIGNSSESLCRLFGLLAACLCTVRLTAATAAGNLCDLTD